MIRAVPANHPDRRGRCELANGIKGKHLECCFRDISAEVLTPWTHPRCGELMFNGLPLPIPLMLRDVKPRKAGRPRKKV